MFIRPVLLGILMLVITTVFVIKTADGAAIVQKKPAFEYMNNHSDFKNVEGTMKEWKGKNGLWDSLWG